MVQEQAAVLGGAGERRNRPKSEFPILIESDPANLDEVIRRTAQKAKGRFLLRVIALSIRFFEDLVRLPDHNRFSRRNHSSPASLRLHFRHSLYATSAVRAFSVPSESIRFPEPSESPVSGPPDSPFVYSLLLEDLSSVELIVIAFSNNSSGCYKFSVWK
jgi:hypothetical protein